MSTWKIAEKIVSRRTPGRAESESRPSGESSVRIRPPVEVVSLEIDSDSDKGIDPYNSTGRFCVPDFDKRDD